MAARRRYLPGDSRYEQPVSQMVVEGRVISPDSSARGRRQIPMSPESVNPAPGENRAPREPNWVWGHGSPSTWGEPQAESMRSVPRPGPDSPPRRTEGVQDVLSPEETLRRDIAAAGLQFKKDLMSSEMFGPGPKPPVAQELSKFHKKYVSMMMLSCFEGLEKGVNVESVVRALTMSAAMWAWSPAFRGQARELVYKGKAAMIDSKQDFLEKIEADVERRFAEAGGHEGCSNAQAYFWKNRLDGIKAMRRGDREPFTAHSAGLAQVSMDEKAFVAMRADGADIEQITRQHRAAVEKLYGMAAYDGVSGDDVSRAARMIIGRQLKDNPQYAAMYQELSHADFTMAKPREVVVDGSGRTQKIWDGAFTHRSGVTVNSGAFEVRKPMSAQSHQQAMASAIYQDLTTCEDTDEMHRMLVTYAVGWGATPDSPLVRAFPADNPARSRWEAAMTMKRAMVSDNLSDQEAQLVYSNAFMDALEEIHDTAPGIEESWSQKYGQSWRSDIERLVRDPGGVSDFWKKADQFNRGEEFSDVGNRGGFSTPDQQSSQDDQADSTSRDYPAPGDTGSPQSQPEPGSGYRMPDRSRRNRRPRRPAGQSTSERYHRARQNQAYNEVDTGNIGFTRDDAQLDNPDFELGG